MLCTRYLAARVVHIVKFFDYLQNVPPRKTFLWTFCIRMWPSSRAESALQSFFFDVRTATRDGHQKILIAQLELVMVVRYIIMNYLLENYTIGYIWSFLYRSHCQAFQKYFQLEFCFIPSLFFAVIASVTHLLC